jgi:hypothetical protein
MTVGRRTLSLFSYSPALASQLRKITEHLSQGSRIDVDTSCANLSALLEAASTGQLVVGPPRLPVGHFTQPFAGRSDFQFAE